MRTIPTRNDTTTEVRKQHITLKLKKKITQE